MALPYPTLIPGLRSPSEQINGLVYFGRMLDKMRLAAAGRLPEGWHPMRGMVKGGFDYRCCKLLGIEYGTLEAETLKGGKSDEELLEWAFAHGRRPSEEEIEIWNGFMTKRGWRDAGTQRLNERLEEIGLPAGTVLTMFEFIDIDEGRLNRKPSNRPGASVSIAHLAVTWMLVGLIWVMQLLVYPQFRKVGEEEFVRYHFAHCLRVGLLIAPLLAIEAFTAACLLYQGHRERAFVISVVLIPVIWLLTAAVYAPLHTRLMMGRHPETLRRLLLTNWLRTVAWTARGLLIAAVLLAA